MFNLNDSVRYWLYSEPTDMRKSFHSLSGIITNMMNLDPLCGDAFIFINKNRTRIKVLHWEPGGMVLYSKLMEAGTLGKPTSYEKDGSLKWRELVLMVEGIVDDPKTRRQRLEDLANLRKRL
ncbi:MAG: IS66 family insertion sequence element accessory protein TnpB [Bacteroidaceae bacterium]|nr:IS66 family insertion sequence element accessory protein TnpB [Bacteroidaceae bacterium]